MIPLTEADEARLREIEAALRDGNPNRAIDLAITALGRGLEHPLVLRTVAQGLEEDGRPDDALALLHRATVLAPEDIGARLVFAHALGRQGLWPEALDAFNDVLALEPDDQDALMGAGATCLASKDIAASERFYRRASALAPESGAPLSALAAIAAGQGDNANARTLGERALALTPGLAGAAIAIARADLAEKSPSRAEDRLARLLAKPDLGDDDRAAALTYLSDALDALDRPAESFSVLEARKTVLLRSRSKALAAGGGDRHGEQAQRLQAYFSSAHAATWRTPTETTDDFGAEVRDHVFLLSFPRSGATLLEQILSSHPDVVALDESGCLAAAGDHLMADNAALARLSRIGPDEARACRDAYWRDVRGLAGADLTGKVFIDKNPLNTVRLPLIAKLFPHAKIVYALRDPRDVVLSCYRRLFYSSMLEFMTLERSALYYDQVMRLMDVYNAKLTLNLHTVRHETLVDDFEAEARPALSFLGLEWDEGVKAFATRLPTKTTTPSAAQVGQGLNTDSIARWRRYATQLAPVLPRLEPWVKRFDYPPSPPTSPLPVTSATAPKPVSPEVTAVLARIDSAARAGNLSAAMAEGEQALTQGLVHPVFHSLRGAKAQQEGRLDVAIDDFETALALSGPDAGVLGALGLCLARAGRLNEGLEKLDAAIALQPDVAPVHYHRGWTLEGLGDLTEAHEAYLRTLTLDPANGQALANLAAFVTRTADWAGARSMAVRALALDPASAVAATALAKAEAAEGDLPAAEHRLRTVIDAARTAPHERVVALAALGDVLDRRDLPAEAFAAYERSAALLRDLNAGRFAAPGLETDLDFVRRLTRAYESADREPWRRRSPPTPASPAEGHVFLVGFPRSGTTMLGQALAGHPEVITLDERETLGPSVQAFMRPSEGLARLASISAEDAAAHRDAYWARIRSTGVDPTGRFLVDKLPLNTLGLPLIAKLFPDAKVLFLRRDPRDVALSAFRRQFALNTSTWEMLSLEGTARFYDAVMTLAGVYQDRLDLDLRIQSYEALVNDFETETRAICDFLGLDWAPGMIDFAGRAGSVSTPSSAQLARGLNSEGVGAWRRYAPQMAPVLPILGPWVEAFGYPQA